MKYLRHLCYAFGSLRLNEITTWSLEKYKCERRECVSPAKVKRESSCLKHLFNKATEWGQADDNAVKGVKLFRKTPWERLLSPQEQEALLVACLLYGPTGGAHGTEDRRSVRRTLGVQVGEYRPH